MEIIALTQNLIPATAALYATVFGEPPWSEVWTTAAATEAVQNPLLRWWVAIEGGEVVGFVAGCTGSPEVIAREFKIPSETLRSNRIGYLAELGVTSQLRRAGLARRLTTELLNSFHQEQVDSFAVRTRPGTGNYPWYLGKLDVLHEYPDGRTLFGCHDIPTL